MASPDPNRFASSAEAGYLRESLAAGKALEASLAARLASSAAALHDADRAVADALDTRASVKENHDTIFRMHADVARSNVAKAGLLHPIRSLPDEVLSEIFLAFLAAEAARHPDGSDEQWHHLCLVPDTVARVSKRWRSVPRLWRYISVVFLEDVNAVRGAWIAGLQSRISRSGSLPVHLLVRGPFPPYDDAEYWMEYSAQGALPPWTRDLWKPLISLVPRRLRRPHHQGRPERQGPVRAAAGGPGHMSHAIGPRTREPSPRFDLTVRAPNLRRIELTGPRLTHAVVGMNTDFAAPHAPARRQHPLPAGRPLARVVRARVRAASRARLGVRDAGASRPRRATCGVFAPEGAFHALGSLRMLVPYYDARPRLQSAFLGGGVLTPGFVELETWRGTAPPWSS